ncbi:cyanophycin synthetase [Mesorhizobium sp. BR1-1-2]|uniref:cyanophycin synthetase n=1 Tax=Mesorhizobium sp. BR1-1-2 TaxID=2876652 RepID=UPI001CCF4C9D|nr:cyanophycin synthetase [Mesorhizobium sp. BR1-1-2]MBZ9965689.1 cyanophycin synthetase [Mesorhizobium sp. BR1-1-2]
MLANELSQDAMQRTIRVLDVRVFRGPHLYSLTPMVQIQIDLGALEGFPTDKLPGFTENLGRLLPGLAAHGCSYGAAGGFLRRMEEGTWLGHVVEHVALELQTVVGHQVTRGKTRSVKGSPGTYNVMFAYQDEAVALLAGRIALELVDSLLPANLQGAEYLREVAEAEGPFELAARLQLLRVLADERALGPTTASLVREAERRGIPAIRIDESSLVLLGQGRHQKRIRASCSDFTSEIATEIASDKDLTKLLLRQAGLPVPKGELVRSEPEAVAGAVRLGYPVVTKPLDGNHGRGVNIALATEEEVRWGFEQAREHSRTVIIEQHFVGSDHRILVVEGRVVAVAERIPAHVIGNGRDSISELVEETNRDPRRGEGHASVLTRIEIDECVEHFLSKSQLALSSVPARGERVFLRPTANLSTGGTAIDRTDEIHPENALIARRAAQIIGLDIAGVDFVCSDISRRVSETGGGIIEVNAGPGFRMHLEPSQGRARNVARPVLDLLFPGGKNGRIPIFAITGTNGKSTTARMLAHVLQANGSNVGLTSTTGIYLNGERIMTGDCSGPKSARIVLREPGIDIAVLECARGGILREGLAFDECDVGAVLNVHGDHLGLKGIDTIEDLAQVKSVVVESVRRGGWSILNADDVHTSAMSREAGGSVCYFSLADRTEWPDTLRDHVAEGGRALTRERSGDGWDIFIHEDGQSLFLMCVDEIPATFEGAAEFNVANSLAAIAMAYCHGVPLTTIRGALAEFTTSFQHSPGRLNVFDGNGFRTIVDYAHNPEGLTALGKLVSHMRRGHQRTIGLVAIPGDRRDCDIRNMGAVASKVFDVIVFKEDENELRGRAPGSIAGLLREGALQAGCAPARMHVSYPEREAVRFCLELARERDLVVLTVDDVEAVWRQVTGFEPAAVIRRGRDKHDVHHLRAS